MTDATRRDRVVGQWVLAVLFATGGILVAVRTWRLLAAEGMTGQSLIWLLALLGFVSLTWRSARAAMRSARGGDAPPA